MAHDEFVDRVIDDFLHQNVTAIVVIGAVADAPDIHAGAQANMLQRGERLDFAFVVNVFRFFSHNSDLNNSIPELKSKMKTNPRLCYLVELVFKVERTVWSFAALRSQCARQKRVGAARPVFNLVMHCT